MAPDDITGLGHVLALIPARGGSVRLPNKNLAEVGGRSLVASAVAVAVAVPAIGEVVVSSDDDRILDEAARAGATTERREERLATSATGTREVIDDLLQRRADVDTLVLLQPTSPLREAADVIACLEALRTHPTATTVAPADHPSAWTFTIGPGETLVAANGSWDLTPSPSPEFRINGAVYAARAEHLRAGGPLVGSETAAIEMPRWRSVDIDEAFDLHLARLLADHPPGDERAR